MKVSAKIRFDIPTQLPDGLRNVEIQIMRGTVEWCPVDWVSPPLFLFLCSYKHETGLAVVETDKPRLLLRAYPSGLYYHRFHTAVNC